MCTSERIRLCILLATLLSDIHVHVHVHCIVILNCGPGVWFCKISVCDIIFWISLSYQLQCPERLQFLYEVQMKHDLESLERLGILLKIATALASDMGDTSELEVHVYMYMHVCTPVCRRVRTCTCTYMYMYMCMCTYTCTTFHVHACTCS